MGSCATARSLCTSRPAYFPFGRVMGMGSKRLVPDRLGVKSLLDSPYSLLCMRLTIPQTGRRVLPRLGANTAFSTEPVLVVIRLSHLKHATKVEGGRFKDRHRPRADAKERSKQLAFGSASGEVTT